MASVRRLERNVRIDRRQLVARVARVLHCDRESAARAVSAILAASAGALRRGETLDAGRSCPWPIRRKRD